MSLLAYTFAARCLLHPVMSCFVLFLTENGDFYPGFPGYGDYYPGQPGDHVPGMTFLPPSGPQGNPPMVEPLPGMTFIGMY